MRIIAAGSRHRRSALVLIMSALLAPAAASAQDRPAPQAKPEDVASIDAIIAALYDVISGPRGQPRDWDRFYSLFAPGARLIPTGNPQGAPARMRPMTPEEYRNGSAPALEGQGFYEREVSRTTEVFGNIAHVFSTYESRRTAEDPKPFDRGINSMQLFNDGTRWWVVTIFWDRERPGNAIPSRYLTPPGGR